MEEKEEERRRWKELGRLGELLLACAVKRHGTHCWESVAKELLIRLKHPFSPHFCQLQYQDLLLRFHNLPLPDELRKLRVLELKQQLLLHNNSISALQMKVKRLKEELSEKEETDPGNETSKVIERVGNESYNESNEDKKGGEITSQEEENKMNRKREGSSRTKRRRTTRGDDLFIEGGAYKRIDVTSQPLIKLLDTLRSHKHGSPFISPLPSQETEKYQRLVRQHMDLDTVECRFQKGYYNDCHSKFYRDLLLIFTNAVIFYRKSSAEHMAARELRKLVIDEITLRTRKPNNNETQPTKLNPEVHHLDPVVKKPRSSTTLSMVSYRRRSSGSMQTNNEDDDSTHAKDPSSNGVLTRSKERDENNKSLLKGGGLKVISDKVNVDDNRGTSKNMKGEDKYSVGEDDDKQEDEGVEPMETTRKKASVDQKEKGMSTRLNKQGVVNFLKRINQNSPSSQEKKKKTKVVINEDDEEEEVEEGEKEEEGERERRTKMRNDRNNNNEHSSSKGKKTKGGNAKRMNANGDETKVKKTTPMNKKMLYATGGRRSLRSVGDETSRRSRPRSRR